MQCPQCGSEMWDNRENKKNPKSPDYKCKDKACAHAIWLDSKKSNGAKAARAPAGPKWTWALLQEVSRNSLRISAALVPTLVKGATSADIVKWAATIFIAASRDGVASAPEPLDKKPAAIVEAEKEDSDVPW